MRKYCYLILNISLFITGCANYGIYQKSNQDQEAPSRIEESEITHRIYLIGDGGNAPMNKSTILLDSIKSRFSREQVSSSCVWLGDNIYPVGLPPKDHSDYALGKHRLLIQAETTIGFSGQVYFIPGNHDWYTYGINGIKRQETLIENYLSSNKIIKRQNESTYFLPNSGCPGPAVVHLDSQSLLVIIDSQWYLSDKASSSDDFSHCVNRSVNDLQETLSDILHNNQEKFILLVSHHPMHTYGNHGGYFKLKDYIFPLSQLNPGLLIPLPFTGFLFNKLRPRLTYQDSKNHIYKAYTNNILNIASHHDNLVIASGHEHNLQYILKNNTPLIISGSGSKVSEVKLGEASHFAAGVQGYAVLDVMKNKEVFLRFYGFKDGILEEIYRSTLFKDD